MRGLDSKRTPEKRSLQALGALRLLGSLGLMVAGGTVCGLLLGGWADRKLEAGGVLTVLGLLLGVGAGLAAAVAVLLREIPWKQ